MADEDALFAEFMGEIKSAVVAVEPHDSAAGDDCAISDTASVGDVNADDVRRKKDAEATKRKGETEASPTPAMKKPRFMGKLVAAALPIKAGAVPAARSGSKKITGKTEKSGAVSTGNGAAAGPSEGATGDKEKELNGGKASPPPLTLSPDSSAIVKGRQRENGGRGKEGVKGGSGAGEGAEGASGGAPGGGDAKETSPKEEDMVGFGGSGALKKQTVGIPMQQHPSQMRDGGNTNNSSNTNNNKGMHMGMPPAGMGGGNMGMMAGGNRMVGFGGGGGYGMPPPGMGMDMGMHPGMNMGMPPGMGGPGPYPDGSMGYGYGGPMNGNGMLPGGPGGGMGMGAAVGGETEAGAAAGREDKVAKAKAASSNKFKRVAGGKSWEDETLAEWPENDYRLFVGDLGNEVTDDNLAGAFRKYASFAKAKIIREKWNKKSKGYGFVSFLDGMDMLKALREQQGKYLGNRPMKISKSSWKDRDVKEVKKKNKRAKKVKKALGLL